MIEKYVIININFKRCIGLSLGLMLSKFVNLKQATLKLTTFEVDPTDMLKWFNPEYKLN